MLLDASLPPVALKEIPAIVKAAEEYGFAALWGTETMHDPFLPGALVAENSHTLSYGTAVAIAFARSPATLAYTAWDLAQATEGRFLLGLGTQVKAHIERRFGMPWPDSVVGKFREQIEAIRAYWDSWQHGTRLNYRGDYYKLNLMSPFFSPGPISHPEIPIYIAGVNTGLARLAGEVADGFLIHPFHTTRYLEEILFPAIEVGLKKTKRPWETIKRSTSAFVVTSPNDELFVRSQIAFYASTPSYRKVMELHGWQDTAEQLSALASRGKWGEMPLLINDKMLETFAIVCKEAELPSRLRQKYEGLVERLSLYLPFIPGEREGLWRSLLEDFSQVE